MELSKFLSVIAAIILCTNTYAAPVTIDFLVNVTDRYTTSNDDWVRDSSFSDRQFTLSVMFDSEHYDPGQFNYRPSQGVSSYRPEIKPGNFTGTPFDDEINAVQPAQDYHGNTEVHSGTFAGEYSYSRTSGTGTIFQSFSQNSAVSYHDTKTEYFTFLLRSTHLYFRDDNADLAETDIAPLKLEEYLSLGYGQTFRFNQGVEEQYIEDWSNGSDEWISIDGGIQYIGTATIVGISAVPVPASVFLFASGLIGLLGFAKRRKPYFAT